MQAGPAATIGWPQAQSPGQTGEPLVQQPGAVEAAALRDQEGVRERVIAEVLALEAIVAKGRGRRRMERHDPRFAELGLENAQVGWLLVQADVGHGRAMQFCHSDLSLPCRA